MEVTIFRNGRVLHYCISYSTRNRHFTDIKSSHIIGQKSGATSNKMKRKVLKCLIPKQSNLQSNNLFPKKSTYWLSVLICRIFPKFLFTQLVWSILVLQKEYGELTITKNAMTQNNGLAWNQWLVPFIFHIYLTCNLHAMSQNVLIQGKHLLAKDLWVPWVGNTWI